MLNAELVAWYRGRDCSKIQGRLTVQRLRTSKSWPKLKAKGAGTRHVVEFALDLASRHSTDSPHDRKRLAVLQLLLNFYRIISAEGMHLSTAAKEQLPILGRQLHSLYNDFWPQRQQCGKSRVGKWCPSCTSCSTCWSGRCPSLGLTLGHSGAMEMRMS